MKLPQFFCYGVRSWGFPLLHKLTIGCSCPGEQHDLGLFSQGQLPVACSAVQEAVFWHGGALGGRQQHQLSSMWGDSRSRLLFHTPFLVPVKMCGRKIELKRDPRRYVSYPTILKAAKALSQLGNQLLFHFLHKLHHHHCLATPMPNPLLS